MQCLQYSVWLLRCCYALDRFFWRCAWEITRVQLLKWLLGCCYAVFNVVCSF